MRLTTSYKTSENKVDTIIRDQFDLNLRHRNKMKLLLCNLTLLARVSTLDVRIWRL